MWKRPETYLSEAKERCPTRADSGLIDKCQTRLEKLFADEEVLDRRHQQGGRHVCLHLPEIPKVEDDRRGNRKQRGRKSGQNVIKLFAFCHRRRGPIH